MNDRAQIAVRNLPRSWTDNAIRLIEADARRSADTHLLRYPLPSAWGTDVEVELYLKDETTHITGSLKHRLARSLFTGDRYADTYFSDEWVNAQGLDPTGPAEALVEFERSCVWN